MKRSIALAMKGLRQTRNWSQEQLAEMSGLSLRTIQRIESSDKAGADSLAALSATFGIALADLGRELAMDKASNGWKRRPGWVRALFFGSGQIRMDKRQHRILEVFAITAGIVFVAVSLFGASKVSIPGSAKVPLLICGALMLLAGYLMSVIARVGDHFSVWPWVNPNAK